MATQTPLRITTLKKFMKSQTALRVDANAVDHLAGQVNAQLRKVVDRAGIIAEMQGRSTVLLRDVTRAIDEARPEAGPTDTTAQSPQAVFSILEGYGIEELGALARQLEASLEGPQP